MSKPARDSARGTTIHQPVLLREVLSALELEPGLVVVDGTVGGGGHSRKILDRIGETGTLIGLDRDPMMLKLAEARLNQANCFLHQASYIEIPKILKESNLGEVDRVLLDLGLSSDQLADESRGFGFEVEGPLDLRFDKSQGQPAWEWIANQSEEELVTVLENFGEERFTKAIAQELIKRRKSNPVRSARDLADAVEQAVPESARRSARKHPATRVFQALRIAVNQELEHVKTAMNETLPQVLKPGGRAVVITFHSLEDRIVKDAFRDQSRWQNLTPHPIKASPTEQRINPRSRTAKLRSARKLPAETSALPPSAPN
jgi:16S rRNA (cytosine1402-N4)-methyltransferase